VATFDIGPESTEYGEGVDTSVSIEIGVLRSNGGEADRLGDSVVSDYDTVFFIVETIEFDRATLVIDDGGEVEAIGEDLVDIGGGVAIDEK
jgi:hypothetical protein